MDSAVRVAFKQSLERQYTLENTGHRDDDVRSDTLDRIH